MYNPRAAHMLHMLHMLFIFRFKLSSLSSCNYILNVELNCLLKLALRRGFGCRCDFGLQKPVHLLELAEMHLSSPYLSAIPVQEIPAQLECLHGFFLDLLWIALDSKNRP